MSDGQRGEPSLTSLSRYSSNSNSLSTAQQGQLSALSSTHQPDLRNNTIKSGAQSSHAQQSYALKSDPKTSGILDLPNPDDVARDELLRDAVFPEWKDDSGGDMSLESPEELQKKDPLGTQIWKLYSRTKTRLPNQERMENLTWRMMAMNLRRREQMQAAYEILILL